MFTPDAAPRLQPLDTKIEHYKVPPLSPRRRPPPSPLTPPLPHPQPHIGAHIDPAACFVKDMHPAFDNDRTCKLVEAVMKCYNDDDVDEFTNQVP